MPAIVWHVWLLPLGVLLFLVSVFADTGGFTQVFYWGAIGCFVVFAIGAFAQWLRRKPAVRRPEPTGRHGPPRRAENRR